LNETLINPFIAQRDVAAAGTTLLLLLF